MDLSRLKPASGSKRRKRVGRGQGSGYGGTSTRGHNGAKSRSGYSQRYGFEGGQMPLQRRVPKYGFTNINRIEYKPVNLSEIQKLAEKTELKEITPEELAKLGKIRKEDYVKILGMGELNDQLTVKAHAFSKSAKKAIEAKEGTAIKL